jgi:hypothetical protein
MIGGTVVGKGDCFFVFKTEEMRPALISGGVRLPITEGEPLCRLPSPNGVEQAAPASLAGSSLNQPRPTSSRWVVLGSRLLSTPKAINLQSGSPP